MTPVAGRLAPRVRYDTPREAVLSALDHGPATIADLVRVTGYGQWAVSRAVQRLARAKRVHVAGYSYTSERCGAPARRWARYSEDAAGDGVVGLPLDAGAHVSDHDRDSGDSEEK